MSEGYADSYYQQFPGDHTSILFMASKPDSFHLGGRQDTQQFVSPSDLEDMLTFENITTITPSELSDPTPGYEFHVYEDTAFPHGLPPISVEIPVATSSMNTRGPPSSATTPHTPGLISPGLVSPSQAAYASSPSQLAVTPPTPAQSLDVYPQYTHSAPVSPYLTQPPPWHTSHHHPSPEPDRPFSDRPRGPMVPQKRYKPHTSSDRRRYVDEVNLEQSIAFFMQKPDEAGIPLKDAMHGRFARLVARDEPMFQERGPSISVRINWPGYQPWSRQIPTRDFRNPPGPITRAKLAKNVAKSVARFIAEHKGRPMEEDGDPAWSVGPHKIDVFDLVLVRLDHVSKGSWQAHLQLLRPRS